MIPECNFPTNPESCASTSIKNSPGFLVYTQMNKFVFSAFINTSSDHLMVILFAYLPVYFQSYSSKFYGNDLALIYNPVSPVTGIKLILISNPSISSI